jgi:hypothetical protein
MPHKKKFYIFIVLFGLIGYGLFYLFQLYVEKSVTDQLWYEEAFQSKEYLITRIEKRIEINSKAKLSKDDYLITVSEGKQIFRTYDKPDGNPRMFNFQIYFDQYLHPNDSVTIRTLNKNIEQNIRKNTLYGWLLEKDNTLIIDIFKIGDLRDTSNIKFYDKKLAIKQLSKLSNWVEIVFVTFFILLAILIYYFKFMTQKHIL